MVLENLRSEKNPRLWQSFRLSSKLSLWRLPLYKAPFVCYFKHIFGDKVKAQHWTIAAETILEVSVFKVAEIFGIVFCILYIFFGFQGWVWGKQCLAQLPFLLWGHWEYQLLTQKQGKLSYKFADFFCTNDFFFFLWINGVGCKAGHKDVNSLTVTVDS